MSNHVFELGIALHIAQGLHLLNSFARIVALAVFSVAIIASRGHYTVDIVLAWWWLAQSRRLCFRRVTSTDSERTMLAKSSDVTADERDTHAASGS